MVSNKSLATCCYWGWILSVGGGTVEAFSRSTVRHPSQNHNIGHAAPSAESDSRCSTLHWRNPPSTTALSLGYLDLGSNAINTAALHASFASDISAAKDNKDDPQHSGRNVVMNLSSSSSTNATDSDVAFVGRTFQQVVKDEDSSVAALIVADLQKQQQQQVTASTSTSSSLSSMFLSPHLGYRLLLAAVACVYGTNFPLGSIMDHALEPSAASSSRFFIAAMALSPFALKLERDLLRPALVAGCFTAMGYITQSLALADTSPATVSFLGAATVIWCPFLEWLIHKEDMSWRERPQVWIAALLCLSGVGLLELVNTGDVVSEVASTATGGGGWMGDGLALLQAVGFGTGIFMSEKMMKKHPHQASSITAVSVAVTALMSMLWAFSAGWMGGSPGWESMLLPNILMAGFAGDGTVPSTYAGGIDPSLLARAVLWTGLVSTSLNFSVEVFALSKVSSGEASVILATEPLWAAAFASFLLGDSMGWNGIVGGMLIVSACLMNGASASDVHRFLGGGGKSTKDDNDYDTNNNNEMEGDRLEDYPRP